MGLPVQKIRVLLDDVHEALAPLDRVRVAQVADHDRGGHLPTQLLCLHGHVLDRVGGDLPVVGHGHQGLRLLVGRRAVEHGVGHPGLVRELPDGDCRLAVERDDDDAIHLLGQDALHLLQLPVGVLGGILLDDLEAPMLQRLDDGLVACDPELGLQVLEGEGDGQLLVSGHASGRSRDGQEQEASGCEQPESAIHELTPY